MSIIRTIRLVESVSLSLINSKIRCRSTLKSILITTIGDNSNFNNLCVVTNYITFLYLKTVVKYIFNNVFILSQNLYRNDAPKSLANSSEPAIIITEKAAPLKSLESPKTEKNAALPATRRAPSPI